MHVEVGDIIAIPTKDKKHYTPYIISKIGVTDYALVSMETGQLLDYPVSTLDDLEKKFDGYAELYGKCYLFHKPTIRVRMTNIKELVEVKERDKNA